MLKRKVTLISIMILCAACVAVGTTLAFLTSRAQPVENTFTVGNIKLSLVETTGESYQMIPGTTIETNPHVTVIGESEDCWLFIKVEKTAYFDDYFIYGLDPGWIHLDGYSGVYFRSVTRSDTDTDFRILKDDTITVRDNLTEEKMSGITENPKISFKAYAIQSYSIESAGDAWLKILKEVTE